MENNLKELCERHEKSDSVTERERLKEEIESVAMKYLGLLYHSCKKYDYRHVIFNDTSFRPDSGSLTYRGCSDTKAIFNYEGSWTYYGGELCDYFDVVFDEIDSFKQEVFEKEIARLKRGELERDVRCAELEVERQRRTLQNYIEKHNL